MGEEKGAVRRGREGKGGKKGRGMTRGEGRKGVRGKESTVGERRGEKRGGERNIFCYPLQQKLFSLKDWMFIFSSPT